MVNDIMSDLEGALKALGALGANSSQPLASAEIQRYQSLLATARTTILEQVARVDQLTKKPLVCAIAVRIGGEDNGKPVLISCEGTFFEVAYPVGKDIKAGDTVTIRTDTKQIVDVTPTVQAGNIGMFQALVDKDLAEVSLQGAQRVVYHSGLDKKPEQGDRVLLDNSGTIILSNLGSDSSRFSLTENPKVLWSEISGQEKAKAAFLEALVGPEKQAELFKAYSKKPIGGILLIGPGGCGKTLLISAAATELATLYGEANLNDGFLFIKGAEVLDKFVGSAETIIRSWFERARKYKKKTGRKMLIAIDELEAIGRKRGTGISSDIESTIVPTLLAEMNGVNSSCAIIIGATNRPDILDPALVRDGRFDYKIEVTRPNKDNARDAARKIFAKAPLDKASLGDKEAEIIAADVLVDGLFSEEYPLCEIYRNRGGVKEKLLFGLRDVVSYAMVAGIAEKAKSSAMKRDQAAERISGINREDILGALRETQDQNRNVNHEDELGDFVRDFQDEVIGIFKLRQVKS